MTRHLRLVTNLEQQSARAFERDAETPESRVPGTRPAAAQETDEEIAAYLAYLEEMDWLRAHPEHCDGWVDE